MINDDITTYNDLIIEYHKIKFIFTWNKTQENTFWPKNSDFRSASWSYNPFVGNNYYILYNNYYNNYYSLNYQVTSIYVRCIFNCPYKYAIAAAVGNTVSLHRRAYVLILLTAINCRCTRECIQIQGCIDTYWYIFFLFLKNEKF